MNYQDCELVIQATNVDLCVILIYFIALLTLYVVL